MSRVRVAVCSPPEIPQPWRGGYGGIERLAWHAAVAAGRQYSVDLISTSAVAGVYDGVRVINSYKPDLYDITLDFTHTKQYAIYTPPRYTAYCFATDPLSGVRDVFATKAVARSFGRDGPVVYPGIDPSPYRVGEKLHLTFYGRFSRIKRPDIALSIARRLGEEVVLMGHVGRFSSVMPDDLDYLKGLTRAVEEYPKAHYIPNPTFETALEVLSHTKLFLSTSDWSGIGSVESFGITVVEALLSGSFVVVTKGSGGPEEIINEETGVVVGSPEDVAVRDYDPRECVERGRYFSPERMVRGLIEASEE